MKKIFTLLTAALMVASCSKSDEPIDPASEKSEAYAAIIDNYLSSTVCPTYRLLADEAEQLVTDLKALQADKSDARVQTACATFLRARAWWEKSEAFLFGAAADFGIDPHIDSWPLDRDGLVNEMRNASHIAAMDSEDGDEWAGTHLGPELLGFHGIEYIIFANGAPKAASAIPDNELIYAIAVAGDLRNKCYQLELSWAGEDNVNPARLEKVESLEWAYTVSGSDNSYSDNMRQAGQAGSSYRTKADAVRAMVMGCVDIADEVGTQKIGKPHTGEDINYIESPYSHMSIVDFTDNVISIENVYYGGIEGKRNESASLHAYLAKENPDLDKRLAAAIAEAKMKVSAMKAPFVLNYTDASATEAMEAMRELTDILTLCKNSL